MRGRISPPAGSALLLLPRRLAASSPLAPTAKAAPGLPFTDSTGPGAFYQLGQVGARPDSVPDVRGDFRYPPAMARPSPGRIATIVAAARLPRSRRQAPAKSRLRFLGYLSSLVDVLPDCRLLMRPLRLFFLRNYRPGRDPLSRRVPLPPTIRLLFRGGAAQNSCARATHWGFPQPTIRVTTDASHMGWGGGGGLCLGRNTYGDWSHYRVLPHMRYWSFRPSFCLSITSYPSFVSALLLSTDNVTVAAYINKQGGTRSTRLNALAAELWTWCRRRDIIPIASYSPGQDKLIADFLSRGRVPPSEWTLHSQVMATIFRTFGPLHWDLFASALYAQLQRYCAQALDPAVWRIEPSQFGGRDSRGTPFPRPHPPNSTEGEAGSGYRPPHCPVVAEENVVPRNDNPSSGVSEPILGTLHPRPSVLHLTAWPLSGRPFSEMLRPLLPAAGGILPERRTFPSCRIFQLVRISGGGSPFGTSDGRGRFLSSLFDKGRLVSKIRGFRSAIAAIHTGFRTVHVFLQHRLWLVGCAFSF